MERNDIHQHSPTKVNILSLFPFPAQSMQNLFQKFSRAKNVSKLHVDGSGLGLFIAKQIIEAHNGRIWAESAGENKGSQFYVELPMG